MAKPFLLGRRKPGEWSVAYVGFNTLLIKQMQAKE
jgi:hypothetical protein